jgi:hypothetical protein
MPMNGLLDRQIILHEDLQVVSLISLNQGTRLLTVD